MSFEAVETFLTEAGYGSRIKVFTRSSATVAEAAEAIGCQSAQIAKTLSFLVAGQPLLVVTAGDVRIHNPKFKAAFKKRGRMIPAAEVEERIGHAPGGVCPFAVKVGVPIYLDESLKQFEVVYPAAGSDHSAVELSPQELAELAQPVGWVDIGKEV